MYDPKTNKYPYTEYTDSHYLEVKKDRGITFDKDYPYIDNAKKFKFKFSLVRFLLVSFVFLVARIRTGLKIEGRNNVRKHKDVLKQGVISCCNHVHMWDFICVLRGIYPYKPRLLTWAKNINGENGTLIRLVGGIPIPENDISATRAYLATINKYLNNGGWLHIYPEGSMWEYYCPIRPFKRGLAYLACKCDKPVLPLAISYRKPGFIRRKIFKQIACFTLHVGEPIFRDTTLNIKEQEEDLTRRCHEAVCKLAGVTNNPYLPIYDNSKRIDYYTNEYGVGYKGSR